MAQIETFNRKSPGGKRMVKKDVRVDLTPMVDLGFLLITFFILTTALSKPTVANLILPKDSNDPVIVEHSATLTVLLQKNDAIDYYEGIPGSSTLAHTSFGNIRSVIQRKQKDVTAKFGDRRRTILIIKPSDESSYKNLIDMLDEVMINDITRYFITDIDKADKALLAKNN